MGRFPRFRFVLVTLFMAPVGLTAEAAHAAKPAQKSAAPAAVDVSAGILSGETPADVKIEKTLDDSTELDCHELPLSDLVDYFKTRHQIDIELDKKALEEAGVALDTLITRHLKGVTLRSALSLALRDLDLTYVIRDEVMLITTTAQAETIMQTRIYPVGDLIDPENLEVIDLQPIEGLVEIITGTIAPTSWMEVGGPGAIKYSSSANSLVVSQTGSVHNEFRDFLTALRKVRALEHAASTEHAADGDAGKMFVAIYPLSSMAIVHHQGVVPPPSDDKNTTGEKAQPAAKPQGSMAISNRGLADDIARAIPKLIEPTTWQNQGGQGTIESVGIGVAVRQTRQVHREIGRLLRSIDTHVPGAVRMLSGRSGLY